MVGPFGDEDKDLVLVDGSEDGGLDGVLFDKGVFESA